MYIYLPHSKITLENQQATVRGDKISSSIRFVNPFFFLRNKFFFKGENRKYGNLHVKYMKILTL